MYTKENKMKYIGGQRSRANTRYMGLPELNGKLQSSFSNAQKTSILKEFKVITYPYYMYSLE